ncbi:RNA 2',3'-cyclic phosphodiesterase [Candidatus Pacearchaeota archaeon]|nr:MAG: RNA 2',3'-cyclic phosphodiesterase [Candidatus Pacearchaeota archaeon]
MRAFISIELPEKIKKEIFKEFEKLKNSKTCFGNFVKKQNLHLTLRFLGDVSEEKIKEIIKTLSEINFPEFKADLGKIGFFPSEKYIKIVWINLISEKIPKLREIINKKLYEKAINYDKKEFNSHITVARIKGIKNKDAFFKKINELNIKRMNFSIDKIFLIKSELFRDGPRYKILKEFELVN